MEDGGGGGGFGGGSYASTRDFQELQTVVKNLQKTMEDENKKTLEQLRKKDASIRELTKEVETTKTNVKSLKKANEETKRSSRELLQIEIAKLREEMTTEFQAALDVGDRMIRSNVDAIINKKFEQGFEVIEKECRALFNKIAEEVDTRADNHEKKARETMETKLWESERAVNGRCKDLILLKMNTLEYNWNTLCSKIFLWKVENFGERMMQMYSRKEGHAQICSPVFGLSLCPRMYVELGIENISRGEKNNEWADIVATTGENESRQRSMKPIPVAGNVTVVIYFAKPVDVLRLKVTLGPPENEVSRIVSHRDFVKTISANDDRDGHDSMRKSMAQSKSKGKLTSGGTLSQHHFDTNRQNSQSAFASMRDKPGGPGKKRQVEMKQGDITRQVFEHETTTKRKYDPLDMCVDPETNVPDEKQEVLLVKDENRPVEIRIHNFGMIQRIWDRRSDSIPVKVEALESGQHQSFLKKVNAPGLNYNMKEHILMCDQFLSPNLITHQVNGWIEKVRNKTRRKATWDIPAIRELCRLVPSGSCIESNIFRLAGLDSTRLVFYPNGIDDLPYTCALYLKSCTEDNAFVVRATLTVNAVSKIFQGDVRDMLGKRKFCSLKNADRVRVTVEINEVADEPLVVHTCKNFGKLEEVFRLPTAGGISSYGNYTLSSRNLTSQGDSSQQEDTIKPSSSQHAATSSSRDQMSRPQSSLTGLGINSPPGSPGPAASQLYASSSLRVSSPLPPGDPPASVIPAGLNMIPENGGPSRQ